MSLLTATHLSQSFGFVDVFTGINVSVPHEAKIGLIGQNGIGKTTLLRLLAGIDEPSWGNVLLAKAKRVGYLRQEAMDAFAFVENTVYQEMLTAFAHLHAIEKRMRELESEMAAAPAHDSRLQEYGDLQEQFEREGGYDYESRIPIMLDGLGFHRSNWDTPIKHLSGGQKTRALLAKTLLESPDLLILDEPTNHLDIAAIEWLEKTLREWRGALIVSSHDRRFLDRVVNTIWEMTRSNIDVFRGNYSDYVKQRDERFQRSVFLFQQEKARMENELRLVKIDLDKVKGGNADKDVTWAKGKLRRLTRDIVTIEKFGAEVLVNDKWSDIAERLQFLGGVPAPFIYDEAEKRVRYLRPPTQPRRAKLFLKVDKRSGDIVLRTERLVVGFKTDNARSSSVNAHRLFECDDFLLTWKDRAALIGPNGAGKTSFIRTALGQIEPLEGEAMLGSSVSVGYFAQAHDQLDPSSTVIVEAQKHRRMSEGEARHFLVSFLFSNDDVFKPVSGLSGGERARLALAILSLQGANLLILDEPTNHLDIQTQEVLQDALENYDGTVLLVSHDRFLIDKLATQVWWIENERLRVYRGSYAEYVAWRNRTMESADETQKPTTAKQRSVKSSNRNASEKPSKNEERKRADKIAQLENQIAELESKLTQIGASLDGESDTKRATQLGDEYAKTQRELDEAMKEWGRLNG
jgi:ATP-binding cassette subfamily F protein 3